MKERPIIFNSEMVRAILQGRKTQTRRVIKQTIRREEIAGNVFRARKSGWIAWFPGTMANLEDLTKQWYEFGFECPYGKLGDRLWARETWAVHPTLNRFSPRNLDSDNPVYFRTDSGVNESHFVWRPSIFMPRWASRITLEITNVRVERVKDISRSDCVKEGLYPTMSNDSEQNIRVRYRELWDSLNKKRGYSWESNPWVWVIEFKRVQA